MIFAYACCNVSVMPVRSEPDHRSEQVNQLLFGEKAEVLEINERDWARIIGAYDGYEGWCKLSQLQLIPLKQYRKKNKWYSARDNNRLVSGSEQIWLPLASDLYGIKELSLHRPSFKGKKLSADRPECNAELIAAYAGAYLQAPYQWGGRTSAGIDCSGLTQNVYKLCGIALPRDAALQANEGETVDFLQHVHCGDLAFFDNAEGKINHVGILLGEGRIIHAADTAGRVAVDKIDQGGIISIQLKKRTHNLRLIKRFF